ncbi:histidine kinase [Planotetraspora sp. A-T 1434]|uniref:sensor histidine kinase n=1 Tax=Planotetraspora sp. A-T 1434 TaxID=2979219 RepID=UPI0021C1AD3D|nr:ATP-binding protein [Planotetraspora sp. A-T 1434]MCT9930533.1 histidine kinase [Planotetraspora sp. A-T 1434]
MASPIVQDPLVWAEWRKQTEFLLRACTGTRSGHVEQAVAALPSSTVRDVGLVAATTAWSELFDTVCNHLAQAVSDDGDWARLQDRVLPELNRGILALVGAFGARAEVETLDRIETAQERLRAFLSRDIHDWIGSGVNLALRRLDLYELRLGSPEGQDDLQRVRQALNDTWDTVRRLVAGLRPHAPETGLEHSLRAFAEAVKPARVHLSVTVRGEETSLPADIRGELYAVVREALRNALTHARANAVSAHATIEPRKVVVVVEDDGTGVRSAQLSGGTGLASMRERTELLGGDFRMTSHGSTGTRIDISVPLAECGHEQ